MKQTDEAADLGATLEQGQGRFMRFLIARTGDPALAEDLMQDARLKIMRQPANDAVASPIPYIFQMLANLVEDHRRSERSRAARGLAWGDRGEGLEPGRAETITPEQSALDRDMLGKTLAALDALPETTRAIFMAYRIEGRAQRQIAVDHELSLSAVEKHLQRAYKAVIEIREKLGAGLP